MVVDIIGEKDFREIEGKKVTRQTRVGTIARKINKRVNPARKTLSLKSMAAAKMRALTEQSTVVGQLELG